MKQLINFSSFFLIFTIFCSMNLAAQSGHDDIRSTISQFTKAADANDVKTLDKILHTSYRIVWPQADQDPFVVPRSVYLEKIESKEWGGDDRQITIEWIKTNGAHATALVLMNGKARFQSLLDLVQVKGQWLLTQDAVEMQL